MHANVKGSELPSVLALSYIGDAYYSLYVRRMLVERGLSKTKELNIASLEYVTAAKQAEMFRRIKEHLCEDELDVARRASNSTHLNPPKHAKIADYRAATGFEAVLGMLYYINDNERLRELLTLAHSEDRNDTEN